MAILRVVLILCYVFILSVFVVVHKGMELLAQRVKGTNLKVAKKNLQEFFQIKKNRAIIICTVYFFP